MQKLPIDFTTDITHVEKLIEDRPAVKDLILHIMNQMKVIITGTRELIIDEAQIPPLDAAITVRFIIYMLFQNYAISTEIYKYYQDYSPVEYEQMVKKLLKQPPEVLVNFLDLAKDDKEKALDYLDEKVEALANANNQPEDSPFES